MANSLTYFVGISAALIMLMFIIDITMEKISIEEEIDTHIDIFNYEGSHISQFDKGNYTLDEDIASQLPTGEGDAAADQDMGNVFTDTFKTIKNWVLDVSGVKYIIGVANALPNLLKLIIPSTYHEIAFALGYLWDVLFVFALVFWLKGGGN